MAPPNDLETLNTIAVAEKRGYAYLSAWAEVAPDATPHDVGTRATGDFVPSAA